MIDAMHTPTILVPRRLCAVAIAAVIAVGSMSCKNEAATEAEDPEYDVEPLLKVTKPYHFDVKLEERRELRRASMEDKPRRSRAADLAVTIKPVDDEIHVIWSSPDVEKMPIDTPDARTEYLITRFNNTWSPSFAVNQKGQFVRLLHPEVIQAGFDAATERAIAKSDNPEAARRMADSRDPLDVMKDIGVRRWNEMGGAFLPYLFETGKPIDVELGKLTATGERACPMGQCWTFEAETEASAEEVAGLHQQLEAMNGRILEAKRTLKLVSHKDTMLPSEAEIALDVNLEIANKKGEPEKGGTTITEIVTYVPSEDGQEVRGLESFPELAGGSDREVEAGESDTGESNAGDSDAGVDAR
jgi:hypothetical protein